MWSPAELRKLRSLNRPHKIQSFLNSLPYHLADTAWSPRLVLRHRTVHCLEGAIFAAAALRVNGYEPLLLDLEATRDTDHVIAVFKQNGAWGAIATSNFAGCRFREPVYRSLRELALSYFNDYFNLRRERTLRRYSRPVNLKKFDRIEWMTTEKQLWPIVYHLFGVPHTSLLTPKMERSLHPVDARGFAAGSHGRRIKK